MTSGISDRAAKWLEDRKLCVDTAARLGVRSQGPAIAFPYAKDGRELYAKLRPADGTKAMRCSPAGVDQTVLWLEDSLKDAEDQQPDEMLIITEGEPDAIAFAQASQRYVVSMPSGAAATAEGCKAKAERALTVADGSGKPMLKPDVARFKRVLVATDCDHDGLLLRQAIVEVIGEEYCWLPTYPAGTKDANDVLQVGGLDAVARLVSGAVPVKSDGFLPFPDAEPKKATKVLSFGMHWLEPHMKLIQPEFIVVGGQAGHGKSTVAQILLLNLLAQNPGLRASIFHGEGDRAIPIQRAKRFLRYRMFGGSCTTPDQQAKRDFWLRERLAYIAPPQDQLPTFEWMLWAMEQQALYRRRNVFMIDPWNEIVHQRPKGLSTTEYVGECIVKLKRLADRLGLILIVTHHVTKPQDVKRAPSRYDLADSAHWANKADHVLLVWKPHEDENKTQLEVEKSKDHDTMGRPGRVWVSLNNERFELLPVSNASEPVAEEDAA